MKEVKLPGVLNPVVRSKGGVHVPHHKHTSQMETLRMPPPEKVYLPMRQHIGAPCTPIVKVGDLVKVGQLIGDSEQPMSLPVHASVSGKVTKISEMLLYTGMKSQVVEITSDGETALYEGITPPKTDTKEEFINAVRASGLAGLGGAGFPTYRKLCVPDGVTLHTLIVNAAECEPFLTTDFRECMENSWDILTGVHLIKEMMGIPQAVIAVEDNKPEAIEVLKTIADNRADTNHSVNLMVLPSMYPQGAEKMLVQSVTGRQVPMGKLPMHLGCLVMNVASVAFLARYIKTGKPLVSRTVTVDGTAIAHPQNVRIAVGTPIRDVIDFCGGYKKEPRKILLGGPMMGTAIADDTQPMLKGNNAILALDEAFMKKDRERACIRCGRCGDACPMHLMPTMIERLAHVKDAEGLERCGVGVCMECGSCAFVCPAHRPLAQYMRYAKTVLREEKGGK